MYPSKCLPQRAHTIPNPRSRSECERCYSFPAASEGGGKVVTGSLSPSASRPETGKFWVIDVMQIARTASTRRTRPGRRSQQVMFDFSRFVPGIELSSGDHQQLACHRCGRFRVQVRRTLPQASCHEVLAWAAVLGSWYGKLRHRCIRAELLLRHDGPSRHSVPEMVSTNDHAVTQCNVAPFNCRSEEEMSTASGGCVWFLPLIRVVPSPAPLLR